MRKEMAIGLVRTKKYSSTLASSK